MSSQPSLKELADEVRAIYSCDAANAESLIEEHLEARLEDVPPGERPVWIDRLCEVFGKPSPVMTTPIKTREEETLRSLLTLMLGRRMSGAGVASSECVGLLARSMNSVFDNLNELVGLIDTTLKGECDGGETIRFIIGSDLAGESHSKSLEGYLNQIRDAFLIANQAYRMAARNLLEKIIEEMNPERISGDLHKGMKFGLFRKAELYEAYCEKFERLKRWFESGRFPEDLTREFEKVCQRLYAEKGGAK